MPFTHEIHFGSKVCSYQKTDLTPYYQLLWSMSCVLMQHGADAHAWTHKSAARAARHLFALTSQITCQSNVDVAISAWHSAPALSALIINRVGNVCIATQPTRPRILSLHKKKKKITKTDQKYSTGQRAWKETFREWGVGGCRSRCSSLEKQICEGVEGLRRREHFAHRRCQTLTCAAWGKK